MKRIKQVSSWAIIVTSIAVFVVWEATSTIQIKYLANSPLNAYLVVALKYIISLAVSYTFFQLVMNLILSGFLKSTRLKKYFLKEIYVDGEWVSFYYMYDKLRPTIETYMQEFDSLTCSGKGFNEDGSDQGETSETACYIFEEEKKIITAYKDKPYNARRREKPGYSEFTLYSSSKKKIPDMMKGYFFELGMKKRILCIAFKADNKVIKNLIKEQKDRVDKIIKIEGIDKANKGATFNDRQRVLVIKEIFNEEIRNYLDKERNSRREVFFDVEEV